MTAPGPPFTLPAPARFVPATYQRGRIIARLWVDADKPGRYVPSLGVGGLPGVEADMTEAEGRAYLVRHLRELAADAEALAREIEAGGPC